MSEVFDDDEYYYDTDDECEHEHATFDILTGALDCLCGYRRYLVGDEFKRYMEEEIACYEAYEEEARKP